MVTVRTTRAKHAAVVTCIQASETAMSEFGTVSPGIGSSKARSQMLHWASHRSQVSTATPMVVIRRRRVGANENESVPITGASQNAAKRPTIVDTFSRASTAQG